MTMSNPINACGLWLTLYSWLGSARWNLGFLQPHPSTAKNSHKGQVLRVRWQLENSFKWPKKRRSSCQLWYAGAMQMLRCVRGESAPPTVCPAVGGAEAWRVQAACLQSPHPSLSEQLQIHSLQQQVGSSPAATRSASARNQPANSFRDAGVVGVGGAEGLARSGGLRLWYCVIDR